MDEVGDAGDGIESICDEVSSLPAVDVIAVDGSLSASIAIESVKSCTPSLSTKKLCSPTVRSKPESRLAKTSCASAEYGLILFSDAICEVGD